MQFFIIVYHNAETDATPMMAMMIFSSQFTLWFLPGSRSWSNCDLNVIERFQSCGQLRYKFIGTKGSVYIRKEFICHRIGLVQQHGRRSIVLEHQCDRSDSLRQLPSNGQKRGGHAGVLEILACSRRLVSS